MSQNSVQKTNKKSFANRKVAYKTDKQKKYQKVVGNKSEGQGYADKRKRKVVNQYRRDRKKLLQDTTSEQPLYTPSSEQGVAKAEPSRSRDSNENQQKEERHREKFQSRGDRKQTKSPQTEPKKTRYWQAEQEHKYKEAVHQKKREEYIERQEKQQAALKAYKEKKRARNKKLSKKTQKGQPVMKYQIGHLLDKLKNMQD